MENSSGNALSKKLLGSFIEDGTGGSASYSAYKWLKTYKVGNLYTGWNSQIYPQFKMETIQTN